MSSRLLELDHYVIRRKILKIFGASFHVYTPSGALVGFSSQKAFKLREDVRVYEDESKTRELLTIGARNIVDFAAAYDIVDATEGTKVGAARRRGWSSILRDSWELLDPSDRPIGTLREDSAVLAMVRRLLSNLVPQTYRLEVPGGGGATMRQHFNPFVYRLEVRVDPGATVDRRAVLGLAVLLAAIEGRQE